MKKIAFFCCALLALGFASCDDKSDLGTIQTNPQEPAVSADAVVPALSAEFAGTTLNLNTVAAQIGGISNPEIENLPAGAEVVYEMQLATKADYSNATILEVENGKVSAEAWNTYYRETLGMNNTPLPNYIRFAAYFVQGTQRYRVGTENTWYGAKQIVVTPKKFEYPVMTVNTPEGNFQLADFAGDGALYTGIGYITSDYTFTFDGKTYGKKTNSTLVEGTTPCTVRNASLYIVEFNPEKLSYKATQVRSLGAIGDFNNWARQSNLTLQGKNKYVGDVDFGELKDGDNTFKFRMSNNNGQTLGGFQYDLLLGGANMDIPGPGVYTITVDLSQIPYTFSYVKK